MELENTGHTNYGYPIRQRRLRSLRNILVKNICPKYSLKTVDELCRFSFVFTLHKDSNCAAFYRSGRVSGTLNPVWENINFLRNADDHPSASDLSSGHVCVRVWMKRDKADGDKNGDDEDEKVLLRWDVNFSGLIRLGNKQQIFGHNVVLFEFNDGLYTGPFKDKIHIQKPSSLEVTGQSRMSYRLGSLRRLELTLRAIKEVNKKSEEIKSIISAILNDRQKFDIYKYEVEAMSSHLEIMREELHRRTKECLNTQRIFESLHSMNEIDELALREKIEQLSVLWDTLHENKKKYFDVRENLIQTGSHLVKRRKQLLTDLASIYPIRREVTELVTPKTKHFIAGVYLPPSEELAGNDEIMLGVALGCVCHLVDLISIFLDVPLRYPMQHKSSRSTIRDDIIDMLSDKEREFPLFAKGKERYQFDYAVYIINKNIVQLRHYCGMSTPNLGSTLSNLYTLLNDKLGVVKNTQNNAFTGQHSLVPPSFGGPLLDVTRKDTALTTVATPTVATSSLPATTATMHSCTVVSTDVRASKTCRVPILTSETISIPFLSSCSSTNGSLESSVVKTEPSTAEVKSLDIDLSVSSELFTSIESLTPNREAGFLRRTLNHFKRSRGASSGSSPTPSNSKFYLECSQNETPLSETQVQLFRLSEDDSSGYVMIDKKPPPSVCRSKESETKFLQHHDTLDDSSTKTTLTAVATKLDSILRVSGEQTGNHLETPAEESGEFVSNNPNVNVLHDGANFNGNCSNDGDNQSTSSKTPLDKEYTASAHLNPLMFKNLMTNTIETPDNCFSSEDETGSVV